MSIRRALIDLDDTLLATQETRIAYINAVAQTDYQFDAITKEFADDPLDPFERLGRLFLEEPDHDRSVLAIPAHDPSLLGLHILKNAGVEMYIATSRKDNRHASTLTQLERLGITALVEDIFMRPEDTPSIEFKRSIARQLLPDFMADDSYSTCTALDFIPHRYLIDRPWNRQAAAAEAHVTRADTFKAAVSHYLSGLSETQI